MVSEGNGHPARRIVAMVVPRRGWRTIGHVAFYIANGLGDHLHDPTEGEMRLFLNAVDASDEEHGAAWLSTESGYTLEWSDAAPSRTDVRIFAR